MKRLISVLILIACLNCSNEDAIPNLWNHIDTVSSGQNQIKITGPHSLDIDRYNYAHIVWRQSRLGQRNYICYSANNPDGTWLHQQIVNDTTQVRSVNDPELSVSPVSNNPYVVYEEHFKFYLAYKNNSSWHNTLMATNSQMNTTPAITVDNSETIHLAWVTEDSSTGAPWIAYAVGDGTNWTTQVLTESFNSYRPVIKVTSQGIAHITYHGGGKKRHAWQKSSSSKEWNYEEIDCGTTGDYSSYDFVIEEDGDIHIAVSGSDGLFSEYKVKYLYKPEGQTWQALEWVTEDYGDLSYGPVSPTIDVDASGSPHFFWMEISGNVLTGNIYWSYRGTGRKWQVEHIIGDNHYGPSLKIDRQGYGHLAFYRSGNSGDYDILYMKSVEPLGQ